MNEPTEQSKLSKAERKRARRKAKATAERAGAEELDKLADEAVDIALKLAPQIVAAPSRDASDMVIDVTFPTVDAARYAIRRVNEQLAIGEWLDVVDVWVWEDGKSVRDPMSEGGKANGVELRMEKASTVTRN